MSRYIDAEKCLKDNATLAIDWIDLLEDEILTPTADVRENVRGEWLSWGVGGTPTLWVKCSNCKKTYLGGNLANFCPNCGADMRKE